MPMDVESYIVQWLKKQGLGIGISSNVPDPRPEEFVTVERFGGNRVSVGVERPLISIRCWSKSRTKAAALANRIESLMPEIMQEGFVTSVKMNSLANNPDETVKPPNPRYEILFTMTYRP